MNHTVETINTNPFWQPFSDVKSFRKRPRLIVSAKDMHCYDTNGRALLDATAGLWCCNAGHCRDTIVKAIQEQAATLDFAPTFNFGHPKVLSFPKK